MIKQQSPPPEIPALNRTQVLVGMAVTAIILWIMAKLWLYLGQVYLLRWYWSSQHLFLGAGIGLIISILSAIIYRLCPPYRRSADYYLQIVLTPLILTDLIWLGLLPGLSEELLFRGVMLPALGLDYAAVVISSLSFGILHLSSPQQWPYMIWATCIGLILGSSALMTGNLLVPLIAHMTTNWVSAYFWKRKKH